jgi:hypothetical protein
MNTADTMNALFNLVGQGNEEACQVVEDAIEEGVKKSKMDFSRVIEKARTWRGQFIPAKIVPNFFVAITPGVSIRIVGIHDARFATVTGKNGNAVDKTFNIGDQAAHGSYTLIFHAPIQQISAKTVTIRGKRLSIAEFVSRNESFVLSEVKAYNAIESQNI